jgi:hypothetical protein
VPGDASVLAPSVAGAVRGVCPPGALTDDLLARAGGGWAKRPKHNTARVASWAETETSLLLGRIVAADLDAMTGRVHQLGDLLVDLVALAQDEAAVVRQVEPVAAAFAELVPQVAGSLGRDPWAAPLTDLVHAARTGPQAWI